MSMQAFHPAFNATIKVARAPLSDDPDTAVAQTIQQMGEYVRQDRLSPFYKSLARQLAGGSSRETARNVFAWIKSRVRFVQDRDIAALLRIPESQLNKSSIAEVLIRPVDIVRMVDPMGDCDDFSMLAACIALSSLSRLMRASLPSSLTCTCWPIMCLSIVRTGLSWGGKLATVSAAVNSGV